MNYKNLFSLVLLLGIGFSSCVDLEFDEPPQFEACTNEANTTIAELKAMYTVGSGPMEITNDIVIQGVVGGDDRNGAFYKVLIFQDETAGIEMRVDMTDLYNLYPVGSNIFVECKGLYLGDYNTNVQIGLYESSDESIARVPEALLNQYVCRGENTIELVAKTVAIGEINSSLQNMLLQINDVEFASFDRGQPYAESDNTTNRTIMDCNGGEIILRTSNFTSFASELTPSGNGSVTAIYTDFGDTKQLYIRGVEDVGMEGTLCSGGNTGGTDLDPNITIADLKELYTVGSGQLEITDDLIIGGNVISSDATGNFFKQLIIQDETGGIEIRIDEYDLYLVYPVGQKVYVECQGLFLGDYNGNTQLGIDDGEGGINRIPEGEKGNFITIGTSLELVNPTVMTIDELTDNHQNMLVQLKDVQFIPDHRGVTYADGENNFSLNLDIEDCDGSTIVLRSSGFADFADQLTPSDNGTITAVFTVFQSTKQLFVRDLNDIAFFNELCEGGGGGGDALIEEDFQSEEHQTPISLDGWINEAVEGPRVWQANEFSNNVSAQITAYPYDDPAFGTVEAWLITPALNLDEASTLTFESAMAFFDHDGLSVMISTDFDGTDISGANWSELNANIADGSLEHYEYVSSGGVDLTAYSGMGYIGFKYVGDGSDENAQTTFQLDNVLIE